MSISYSEFVSSRLGRPFSGVLPEDLLKRLLVFLMDNRRIRRMDDAEIHHDRPAVAGVIVEIESHPEFREVLSNPEFRKALGAMVFFLMTKRGWRPACYDSRRPRMNSQTVKVRLGVSKQLSKASRFAPPEKHPEVTLWVDRHLNWKPREQLKKSKRMGTGGKTAAQEMADILKKTKMRLSRFAKKMGVSETSVRLWRQQARTDSGKKPTGKRAANPTALHLEKARRILAEYLQR